MSKYRIQLDHRSIEVELLRKTDSSIDFSHEGRVYSVQISRAHPLEVKNSSSHSPVPSAPAKPTPAPAQDSGGLTSPIPGKVVSIAVGEGESVEVGQTLLVIEAMKMENNIPSPVAGKIASLEIKPGDQVEAGQTLIVFE